MLSSLARRLETCHRDTRPFDSYFAFIFGYCHFCDVHIKETATATGLGCRLNVTVFTLLLLTAKTVTQLVSTLAHCTLISVNISHQPRTQSAVSTNAIKLSQNLFSSVILWVILSVICLCFKMQGEKKIHTTTYRLSTLTVFKVSSS